MDNKNITSNDLKKIMIKNNDLIVKDVKKHTQGYEMRTLEEEQTVKKILDSL